MPGRNTGTNTIFFIQKGQVPRDRAKDVTYGLITTLIRPEKIEEPNRTRLVAGGDRVHYPGDAGMPTIKILLNSIISTPNAKFMTMDIKNFYLNTLSDMPEDVIAQYKLNEIATLEGYIYCEIQKGMYSLPQARVHCPATSRRASPKGRLPPEQNHARFVDARYPPNQFLPCCR